MVNNSLNPSLSLSLSLSPIPFPILLVEDESSIADNIVMALSNEGFSVTHKKNVAETQKELLADKYSLYILDVGLPDGNGFDICKSIRTRNQRPILFLTARSEEIDKIVGFELGADDYLTKPFSLRELVARVRALIRRSQAPLAKGLEGDFPNDSTLQLGPIELDRKRQRLRFCGKELETSRYEFKIMEILIKRPGYVYSRRQLMDLVWDSPEMSLERTVDTHIKSLRAKFRDINASQDVIETHRGFGYSINEFTAGGKN